MDKDKKWDRKEDVTVDPGSLLSAGVDVHLYRRERIMESMHMVGVELRKKPEKMIINIGWKIMDELIFGVAL